MAFLYYIYKNIFILEINFYSIYFYIFLNISIIIIFLIKAIVLYYIKINIQNITISQFKYKL